MSSSLTYHYEGKLWQKYPSLTETGSFFDAVFGNEENGAFSDKQVDFKRSYWSTFLTYYKTETKPCHLEDVLKKCLRQRYKHIVQPDEEYKLFDRYISDVRTPEHRVSLEEIPIIAALWNVPITVISREKNGAETVNEFKPETEILGDFSLICKQSSKRVVLCFDGDSFSKLCPVVEHLTSGEIQEDAVSLNKDDGWQINLIKYNKRGTAGIKGVQFQLDILTMFMLNSFMNLRRWHLSTENTGAGVFDDAVVEWEEGVVMLQAKQKDDKTKKITLQQLLSNHIKNNDFGLPKYIESYVKEIKDNFNVTQLIICVNVEIEQDADRFLEPVNDCGILLDCYDHTSSIYTLRDTILTDLKRNILEYYKNKEKATAKVHRGISDEDIKEFLSKLWLVFKYPSGEELRQIIEQLLSKIMYPKYAPYQISYMEISAKIKEWFEQKKGVYLTDIRTKSIFFDIRRDQYFQKLENYGIRFANQAVNLIPQQCVFHVKTTGSHLTQEIRLFSELKSFQKTVLVFIEDDIETQRDIICAFRLPHYTHLVINSFKITDITKIDSICSQLREIINSFEYKKIILLAPKNDKFADYLNLCTAYYMFDLPATFKELRPDSKHNLLTKKCIDFQGEMLSLKQLISLETAENYADRLSPEVLESLIEGKTVSVGLKVAELEADVSRYYISRSFERENDTFSEEDLCDVNDKIILIADAAGTGKTTVLKKLALTYKARHPQLWVIRLKLNEYTKEMQQLKEQKDKTVDILQLLQNMCKFNELENLVFIVKEKVVLMLDGVDEIAPEYTDLVVYLLEQCRHALNLKKVFVTTRTNLTSRLEKVSGENVYKLIEFSEEDQLNYLVNYWKFNFKFDKKDAERCGDYASKLLQQMKIWTDSVLVHSYSFTGVPLQTRILAEVFQDQISDEQQLWDGCKEYVNSNKVEPTLPDLIDIGKIYRMFLNKKRAIFLSRSNIAGNPKVKKALEKQFDDSLTFHRNLATEVILGKFSSYFTSFQTIDEYCEEILLEIGIIQKVGDTLYFVHKTFAEYFCAENLVIELQKPNKTELFQIFIIDKTFFCPAFIVVQKFIDSILKSNEGTCSKIVFDENLNNPPEFRPNTTLIHFCAANGYLSILRLFLKCLDFKTIIDKEISIYNSVPQHIPWNTMSYLKYLVSKAGINLKMPDGRTPLHSATSPENLEMLQFLIDKGGTITDLDMTVLFSSPSVSQITRCLDFMKFYIEDKRISVKKKGNLLHLTVKHIYLDNITRLLIEKGIDVNSLDENNQTPLHLASQHQHLNAMKLLIDKGAMVNILDKLKQSPLHLAAASGSISAVKLLLNYGANMDRNKSHTPVHIAMLYGNLDIVELFVQHGAKFKISNKYDRYALDTAASRSSSLRGYTDIVNLILEKWVHSDNYTLAYKAAYLGKLDILTSLIEKGLNVNRRVGGENIIFAAVRGRQINTAKYLIQHGANVNSTVKHNGHTPLHTTLYISYKIGDLRLQPDGVLPIMKLLVENGADVNLQDKRGESVLHKITRIEFFKYFCQWGADVNIRDKKGRLPLHIASYNFNPFLGDFLDIVKFLILERGMDANVQDNKGRTPLHMAVNDVNYIFELTDFLIQKGEANVNMQDNAGCTPLHLYISRKLPDDYVKYIVHRTVANVNIQDNAGRTPLHLAVIEDNLNVILILNRRTELNFNIRDNDGKTPENWALENNRLDAVRLIRRILELRSKNQYSIQSYHYD